jgi:hypothetical protein
MTVCAVAVVSHNTSPNKNWTKINLIIISLHHCHYRSADWIDAQSRSPVVIPTFCSRFVDSLWWEPQSGRYSNTGTFRQLTSMVQKLINALNKSSNICTTWFNVTTLSVLSAQCVCVCVLHVSLTTNHEYFPENFNWLLFVIAVDCSLWKRNSIFCLLSFLVYEESKLLRLLSWCVRLDFRFLNHLIDIHNMIRTLRLWRPHKCCIF